MSPIYDFKCPICGNLFESIEKIGKCFVKCPDCGFPDARKIFSGTRFIPFKSYFETNLGHDPVEIKSKKQLRSECNKHGLDYV